MRTFGHHAAFLPLEMTMATVTPPIWWIFERHGKSNADPWCFKINGTWKMDFARLPNNFISGSAELDTAAFKMQSLAWYTYFPIPGPWSKGAKWFLLTGVDCTSLRFHFCEVIAHPQTVVYVGGTVLSFQTKYSLRPPVWATTMDLWCRNAWCATKSLKHHIGQDHENVTTNFGPHIQGFVSRCADQSACELFISQIMRNAVVSIETDFFYIFLFGFEQPRVIPLLGPVFYTYIIHGGKYAWHRRHMQGILILFAVFVFFTNGSCFAFRACVHCGRGILSPHFKVWSFWSCV